jgi:hypothetical protein
MDEIINLLLWWVKSMGQILAIVGSIAVVVIGWYLNEKSKRKWEAYKRKEDSYKELIRTLKGFYEGNTDSALKEEFLNQLNLCWLYSSDEVIKSAYSFLNTVHTDKNPDTASEEQDNHEKEEALSSLVLAMRKDILSGKTIETTNLTKEDFRHLKART